MLHTAPFKGTNNRKLTKARRKMNKRVQSITIFNEDGQFEGYKYIFKHIN